MALDFAVVNALGLYHHSETFERPLGAAIAYSKRKQMHLQTRERCAQAGLAFEPVVFDAQGGVEPRAAAILHKIAEAVAVTEGRDMGSCKHEMLQRLAVIIAWTNSRAVRRRIAPRISAERSAHIRGSKRVLDEMAQLGRESYADT